MSAQLRLSNLTDPCMKLKKSYDPAKLEKVKLVQEFAGAATRKKECPVHACEGVEAYLHVVERFDRIAEYVEWNAGQEKFGNFEEVLKDTALEEWNNLTAGIPNINRTNARFIQERNQLLTSMVTSRGRDYVRDYLESEEVQKKHDADCSTHAKRIQTLVRLTNQLPGTMPAINEAETKKIVFKSFHPSWQGNYHLSGRDYNVQTIAEIVHCMSMQKV